MGQFMHQSLLTTQYTRFTSAVVHRSTEYRVSSRHLTAMFLSRTFILPYYWPYNTLQIYLVLEANFALNLTDYDVNNINTHGWRLLAKRKLNTYLFEHYPIITVSSLVQATSYQGLVSIAACTLPRNKKQVIANDERL